MFKGNKTFTQGKKVTIEKKEIQESTIGYQKKPIWVGPNDKIYDKFYSYIPFITTQRNARNSVKKNMILFPSPQSYENFQLYSTSLINWYYEFRYVQFSSLVLPIPISGEYYFPQKPTILSKKEMHICSRLRSSRTDIFPISPINYLKLIDVLLRNDTINPDEPLPEKERKTELFNKEFLTSNPQWQDQMILHEPYPFIYKDFNEYEKAYLNWTKIVNESIRTKMIPPKDFQKILSLDIEPRIEQTNVPCSQDQSKINSLNLSEWKNVKKPNMKTIKLFDKNINDEYIEQKIDDAFVKEMILYGYEIDSLKEFKPYHVTHFHVTNIKHSKIQIPSGKINNMFFLNLLKYDYSRRRLNELMNTKLENNVKFNEILYNYLFDVSMLKKIMLLGDKNIDFQRRISFFLRSFINNIKNINLFEKLIKELQKNNVLYDFVNCLMFSVDPNFYLYQTEENIEIDKEINFFYIMNVLIQYVIRMNNINIYNYLLNFLRKTSDDLKKKIQNSEVLQYIRYKNKIALIMLFLCDSSQIHKSILGKDSLSFINELSKDKKYSKIVSIILHNHIISTVSSVIINNFNDLIQQKLLDDLTQDTTRFLQYVIDYINYKYTTNQLKLGFPVLSRGLELISINILKNSYPLYKSLFMLICNQDIITNINFDESTLSKATLAICSIDTKDTLIFLDHIKVYNYMIKNNICCSALSQHNPFLEIIAQRINDQNSRICQQFWDIFKKLLNDIEIFSNIMSSLKVQNCLKSIPCSENILAIENLLILYISILSENNSTKRKITLKILISSSGSLAMLYKSREEIFKLYPKLQKLIIEFMKLVFKSKGSHSSDLQNAFTKHIKDSKNLNL